jgi:hypothetical protein|tara:strand:+ start:299 stop:505 length:207 start_codon:yes stop_codon:yes gene_type:complete
MAAAATAATLVLRVFRLICVRLFILITVTATVFFFFQFGVAMVFITAATTAGLVIVFMILMTHDEAPF